MSYLTDELRAPTRDAQPYITVQGEMLEDIVAANPERRTVLKQGVAGLAILAGGSTLAACGGDNGTGGIVAAAPAPTPAPTSFAVGFTPVPANQNDVVTVPAGYVADVLFSAGDPVGVGAVGFSGTLGINAGSAVTERWAGGNHDGMHYFSAPGVDPNVGGFLVVNHEFPDASILFPGGTLPNPATATAEQRAVVLSAVGVSVLEIQKAPSGSWSVKRDSVFNKRYTGNTPMRLSGGATSLTGTEVKGTLNNCANGFTPWGTYLTCEETTDNYFEANPAATQLGFGYVVEIDPRNPNAQAIKRTSMGRFDHENVAFLTDASSRVAFYMGDDSTPGCIYKFVPTAAFSSTTTQSSNLLDTGTLFVARFNADGTGTWRALVQGQNGLVVGARDPGDSVVQSTTPAAPTTVNFATQADVLVNTKSAARVAGGTLMDRPEWITVGPLRDGVNPIFATLTNNSGRRVVDAANPRPENRQGHIIRFTETGNSPLATTFNWSIFLLAGSPALATPAGNQVGNINGDVFSSPDGIWIDPQNRLFVQTDQSLPGTSGVTGVTLLQTFGNNGMYYLDQTTRRSSRFLVGPVGQEITGIIYPPDLTAYFINVQHPTGNWPVAGQPPRSSTIVVRRTDGQPVGA